MIIGAIILSGLLICAIFLCWLFLVIYAENHGGDSGAITVMVWFISVAIFVLLFWAMTAKCDELTAALNKAGVTEVKVPAQSYYQRADGTTYTLENLKEK
jgi:hypothetical protein